MRALRFCAFAVVIALVSGATVGCARHGSVDPKAPIIIISIDTLRSDHLPAYGYSKIETPALDRFRADSILFERAYSQCPLTLVSHASVFTGLLPAEHGIRDNIGYKLDPKATTLAQLLKGHGYATGGAVSALVLSSGTGVQRGFDFWDDAIDNDPTFLSLARAQRSGDATREIAQKWIGEHKAQPFFFFFHIYEPHSPYEPPEPFKSKYGNTYDGEVATADDVVGKFLDYLRAEGLYDKATIVLMSDHGEGLGDHGEDEHGVLLYRETLQVALMLKLPHERQKGTSVAAPVQLIDIFPTLAQPFGANVKADGASLLDVADGKVKDERSIYSETYYPRLHFGWSDLHSLIAGANHYIQSPKPELYDVVADPAETKNTLADNRRAYTALREKIQPFIHAAAAPGAVDDEQKQQLLALGYVGSTVSTDANAVLPNPRDNIGKANTIAQGFRAVKEERYDDALKITGALLRENPNMADIWALQARALEKLNRPEEAIESAKQGLRLSPTATNLAAMIATLALDVGRYDEAEQHAKLTLNTTPHEGHRLLAQVYMGKKEFAKARQEAELVEGSKQSAASLMLLGRIDVAEGHVEQGLQTFRDALAKTEAAKRKPLPKLNFFLGDALARLGRADEAETAFRNEITLFPTDPQPYKNLILLYAAAGKNREATDLIFSLEKASPTPESYLAIAETLKIIGDRNGARFWAARGLSKYPADRQLSALYRG